MNHGFNHFVSSVEGKKEEKKKKGEKGKVSEQLDETSKPEVEQMGTGCYEFPNGSVYEGEWRVRNGEKERDGAGVYMNSGEVYRGDWKENEIQGRGQHEFANGDTYKGEFNRNMFDGAGTYTWADGSSYVGQWYKNKMHGMGTFTTKNGDRYRGNFLHDQFQNSEGYWIPPSELTEAIPGS